MFDLDTINKRNTRAVDRAVRKNQLTLRHVFSKNPIRLLSAVEAGMEIDLEVGRYDSVMVACEHMMDIAFRCAPKAIEALIKQEKERP